jgi:hypothetical protein
VVEVKSQSAFIGVKKPGMSESNFDYFLENSVPNKAFDQAFGLCYF